MEIKLTKEQIENFLAMNKFLKVFITPIITLNDGKSESSI